MWVCAVMCCCENDDDDTARRRSRESTRKHDELVFGISGSKKHRKPNNDQNAKSQIPNRRMDSRMVKKNFVSDARRHVIHTKKNIYIELLFFLSLSFSKLAHKPVWVVGRTFEGMRRCWGDEGKYSIACVCAAGVVSEVMIVVVAGLTLGLGLGKENMAWDWGCGYSYWTLAHWDAMRSRARFSLAMQKLVNRIPKS